MFDPDWQQTWTAEEAEKELEGFKFEGPGWYLNSHKETILVIPKEVVHAILASEEIPEFPWKRHWPKDTLFVFNAYMGWSPTLGFSLVVNAPTRRIDDEADEAL